MRLVELFNKLGKWKWRIVNDNGAGADLFVGEHQYDLMIEEDSFDHYVSMIKRNEGEAPQWLQELTDDFSVTVYQVEFEFEDRQGVLQKSGDKYGVTGTGNQYEVFATVMAAMKDFANQVNVEYWIFTADEPSRRKLYNRMAKRFSRGRVHTFELAGAMHYVIQAS